MATVFEEQKEGDERAKFYDAQCKLNILNSNRDGCTDDCTAEVFWGNYPYDQNTQKKFQLRTEKGCTLYFRRLDNGLVNVFIFPGRSENNPTITDGIIIKRKYEPKLLLNKRKTKKLWQAFMAYTECTSLDGEPNLCQRLLYFWYGWTCHRVHDGAIIESKLCQLLSHILKWVITVGLSGALLMFVTKYCNDEPKPSKTINETNILKQGSKLDSTKSEIIENPQVKVRGTIKVGK